MKPFTYTGARQNRIVFPLGGIGTGCIGLAGNGRLVDWEIFNRPNKGSVHGFSHFAVKAESGGKVLDARVLNGDMAPPYDTGAMGPNRQYLAAVPHFRDCAFQGEFPMAELELKDRAFPGTVTLSAFNPFIPLNEDDSSIPAAFFEVAVRNPTRKRITYTIGLSVGNPTGGATVHTFRRKGPVREVELASRSLPKSDPKYGTITMATDARDVSCQEYWFRGRWFDSLGVYWQDLNRPGKLRNRRYPPASKSGAGLGGGEMATLAAHVTAAPGQTVKARFVIAWHFPTCENYWNPVRKRNKPDPKKSRWKNYYAKLFKGSPDAARYALKEWDRLEGETRAFKDALFSSSLPAEAIDAIAGNIAILKSPTVLRLQNGELYGFEGCHDSAGCCEGSCTHVWAYAQAAAFLFPRLERSMRDVDSRYNYADDGSMSFRLQLPLGRPRNSMRPCVDGQYAGVLKTYRDWKISGDDRWMKQLWPKLKKNIEWAWSEANYDRWDRNKDGVLEGRQHHTLDMELIGPSSWLNGFYLAALKAGAEMADYFGEPETAAEYRRVFARGKKWVDKNLFNGEYYHQKLNVKNRALLERFARLDDGKHKDLPDVYWDAEHKEIKYQVIEGCALDQILAQWHADLYGLGEVFDPRQARKATRALYRHNFKKSMRHVFNPCRVYSLNDEGGLMICEWPQGKKKPACPLTYSEETMNGFEYAGAITMIQQGLVKEGLEGVAAIRQRYNGENRNPWNEFECGFHYARSMASYALLNVLSGFAFDMPRGRIGFDPILKTPGGAFDCFWSLDSGWGMYRRKGRETRLEVTRGSLTIRTLDLPYLAGKTVTQVALGSRKVAFTCEDGCLTFKKPVTIAAGKQLVVAT